MVLGSAYERRLMTGRLEDTASPARRVFLKGAGALGFTALFSALHAYGGNVVEAARLITFAGYQWQVKSHPTALGPGPNLFSDSTRNVWVDSAGRLHLRITRTAGRWHCAEVINTASLAYGTYRWVLDSPVDNLDPNVVLGLFTWNDDPAYHHRELDIEFARWGQPYIETAQYVVQPWDTPGQQRRFWQPAGLRQSTHSFTWAPAGVRFQSAQGDVPAPLGSNDRRVFAEWQFANGAAVPVAGGENARMNLWLDRGRAPSNRREVEVVFRSFQFQPQ